MQVVAFSEYTFIHQELYSASIFDLITRPYHALNFHLKYKDGGVWSLWPIQLEIRALAATTSEVKLKLPCN